MGTNSFVNLPTIGVGYAATIDVADVPTLAALITLGPITEGGYQNGQQAFVESTGQLFVLRTALGGAANGLNVVTTSDDPSRQWINSNLLDGSVQEFESVEVDFTVAPQPTISLVPSVPGYHFVRQTAQIKVTAQAGTATATLTIKGGNNATQDNMIQSQSNPSTAVINGAAAVVPWLATLNTSAQGVTTPLIDIATPATVDIVAGASGTGGFILRGKVQITGYFVKV